MLPIMMVFDVTIIQSDITIVAPWQPGTGCIHDMYPTQGTENYQEITNL